MCVCWGGHVCAQVVCMYVCMCLYSGAIFLHLTQGLSQNFTTWCRTKGFQGVHPSLSPFWNNRCTPLCPGLYSFLDLAKQVCHQPTHLLALKGPSFRRASYHSIWRDHQRKGMDAEEGYDLKGPSPTSGDSTMVVLRAQTVRGYKGSSCVRDCGPPQRGCILFGQLTSLCCW